uniref:Uncharacterized protein n=1 Tax=Arundo donax TaxID=35708 RepID=A0A0A9GNU8_ARUDO
MVAVDERLLRLPDRRVRAAVGLVV